MADEAVAVRENPAETRFEIVVGKPLAGFTVYRVAKPAAEYAFVHTEISSDYAGRGLGTTLIRSAMDDMMARQIAVLPYCPFVKAFIASHSDYLSLVPAESRAKFGLTV